MKRRLGGGTAVALGATTTFRDTTLEPFALRRSSNSLELATFWPHLGGFGTAGRYTTVRTHLADLMARVVVGGLFALLSMNLLADFAHTRRITGLLLLVSEALVVVLTVVRRRASIVDRTPGAAAVTAISLAGPALVRTAAGPGLIPDEITAAVSALGLIVVIAGKITLGRSFGIAPANRGVVIAGPYGFVRHPIYAGYVVTHLAFACAHPTPWNVAILVATDAALIIRALYEERVLAADRAYQLYCRRVAWHIMPGVF